MMWCNRQEGRSRKWGCLDRVVVNIAFANFLGSSYLEYLSRKSSDHNPKVVFFDMSRFLIDLLHLNSKICGVHRLCSCHVWKKLGSNWSLVLIYFYW